MSPSHRMPLSKKVVIYQYTLSLVVACYSLGILSSFFISYTNTAHIARVDSLVLPGQRLRIIQFEPKIPNPLSSTHLPGLITTPVIALTTLLPNMLHNNRRQSISFASKISPVFTCSPFFSNSVNKADPRFVVYCRKYGDFGCWEYQGLRAACCQWLDGR